MNSQDVELIRINRDVNGNPRYVTHFLNLLSDKEQDTFTHLAYIKAVNKARSIGGKKYRGKEFGGGIVFQSYDAKQLQKDIISLRNGENNEL